MPNPRELATPRADRKPDEATEPRGRRLWRWGCVSALTLLLLTPIALVAWFFASLPRGGEQLTYLVLGVLWPSSGADTQIVIYNDSGHEVRIEFVKFDDELVAFDRILKDRHKDGLPQKSIHYQAIYWRVIVPELIPVEIRYTELDSGFVRSGSFTADRRSRAECKFVVFLESEGPRLSECRPSDLEDFDSE